MKKLVAVFLLALGALAITDTALAADVVITSVGQASDGMMVKVLMNRMNIDADYDSALSAGKMGARKIVIAVVGASSKGLGAAGITRDEERRRGRALLQEAQKRNIKVLVMHIGGDRRRGELTDAFIEAVTGFADGLIVVKPANADGIFNKAKPPGARLTEVETVRAAVPALEATFKEWGVAR